MATTEDLMSAVDEVVSDGVRRGLLHNDLEDESLDGRHVTIGGRRLVNFGSCSYLGLELHPALRAGVVDAVTRWGTQFSSSRVYASAPPYRQAEDLLAQLFGRRVVVTPSTSMGHLAAMPALIGDRDVLVLDHQVHASVQTAARLVQAGGARVELLPHNDLRTLERKLVAHRRSSRRVWYAADGLYSMYADFLPTAELDALARAHDNLWLYVDDAHAVSWTGRHGRGHALEHLAPETLRRTVVAASLNKSFAAAGGAIAFPDEETRRRVLHVAGPLIFSGPVQPPMLGAIVASARLHLSAQLPPRQEVLRSRIRTFNRLAAEAGLPVVTASEAPIRCVGAGVTAVAYRLTGLLREAGFHVNTASFPAVPAKRSGARLTVTAHHTEEDVAGVVGALGELLPRAIAAEGATMGALQRAFARQLRDRPQIPGPRQAPDDEVRRGGGPHDEVRRGSGPEHVVPGGGPDRIGRPAALRLEHHRSIAALDAAEWDGLLGGNAFTSSAALRAQELAFATAGAPQASRGPDDWDFHYWLVRDRAGRPVAATVMSAALWKADMLSPEHVSREVERRRAAAGDPHLLASTMLGSGTLLTQGEHLWLDRSADWRAALRLVLQAARAEEDTAGAAGLLLRDLPDGDAELHEVLLGEGFLRIPLGESWVRDVDFPDDETFLAALPRKARQHQRRHVLAHESAYRVEVLPGGSPQAAALPAAQRDRLYAMYRDVHARNLGLNVFPLPRGVIDAVLGTPGWETLVLHLPGVADQPVAFGTLVLAPDEVATVFLGLDRDFVASHSSYQQLLWQALRAAVRHGTGRVVYGMSAGLHKARFGARAQQQWAYVQATDTFDADVLARIAESVPAG